MIVKPSIAFNDFAGSAKGVTARNVKGRNILSSKAQHSKSVTPAQAVSRNRLSSISRSYKKLSDLQMSAWGRLAEKMKGISTLSTAAEMTAHNAFVRINSNRAMVCMPPLEDAPIYKDDVPEVIYEDLWISPALEIVFLSGLGSHADSLCKKLRDIRLAPVINYTRSHNHSLTPSASRSWTLSWRHLHDKPVRF